MNQYRAKFPLRMSSLPQLTMCMATMDLPRENGFRPFRPKKNASGHVVGAYYGTMVHKMVEDGKIPLPPSWLADDGEKEGRVGYNHAPMTSASLVDLEWSNKARDSYAFFTGTADYVAPSLGLVGDVKTSAQLKDEQFIQLAAYSVAHPLQPSQRFDLWNIRDHEVQLAQPEVHKIKSVGPEKVAELREAVRATMDFAIAAKQDHTIDLPQKPSFSACGFCASRFFCTAYKDRYLPNLANKKPALAQYQIDSLKVYDIWVAGSKQEDPANIMDRVKQEREDLSKYEF